MTSIKKPAFSPIRQVVNALEGKQPQTPSTSPVSGGWLPKVVKTPQRSEKVDAALSATAVALRGGLQKGFEATKQVNEATVGQRSTNAQEYKYQGALEVGLEALNRTFEGGGIDVKRGLDFIEKNSKKK